MLVYVNDYVKGENVIVDTDVCKMVEERDDAVVYATPDGEELWVSKRSNEAWFSYMGEAKSVGGGFVKYPPCESALDGYEPPENAIEIYTGEDEEEKREIRIYRDSDNKFHIYYFFDDGYYEEYSENATYEEVRDLLLSIWEKYGDESALKVLSEYREIFNIQVIDEEFLDRGKYVFLVFSTDVWESYDSKNFEGVASTIRRARRIVEDVAYRNRNVDGKAIIEAASLNDTDTMKCEVYSFADGLEYSDDMVLKEVFGEERNKKHRPSRCRTL